MAMLRYNSMTVWRGDTLGMWNEWMLNALEQTGCGRFCARDGFLCTMEISASSTIWRLLKGRMLLKVCIFSPIMIAVTNYVGFTYFSIKVKCLTCILLF